MPLAPAFTVDFASRPIPLRLTDQSNRLAPLQARPPAPHSLAASPDLSLLLLAPVSTDYFAPRPIPLHTQISQTSLLPFKPVCLLHAPLAAHPDACRLRSALPLQFPATASRSSLYSLPLACASHAHHQTRGHVSFPQHSSATRDLSSALLTFPSPTPSPPSFAPRVHGSTFHLPLDLLPSSPPLASDPSQPPKPVTALAQRTHPSHSCRRSVLSLFPTPSASSPM